MRARVGNLQQLCGRQSMTSTVGVSMPSLASHIVKPLLNWNMNCVVSDLQAHVEISGPYPLTLSKQEANQKKTGGLCRHSPQRRFTACRLSGPTPFQKLAKQAENRDVWSKRLNDLQQQFILLTLL